MGHSQHRSAETAPDYHILGKPRNFLPDMVYSCLDLNNLARTGDSISTTLRVLIIDDNPDDRALVIRELGLEYLDLHVRQITEAQAFADALQGGNFDLVITDSHLLWTDGLSVLRAVKARHPGIPVIMFTGTGNEERAGEALQAGLGDYNRQTNPAPPPPPNTPPAALGSAPGPARGRRPPGRPNTLLKRPGGG